MTRIQFTSLEDCIACYGRENLIPIDSLPQIIFYTANGCQPKFICENEIKPGRISCWFEKSETAYIYKKWQESHPRKDK